MEAAEVAGGFSDGLELLLAGGVEHGDSGVALSGARVAAGIGEMQEGCPVSVGWLLRVGGESGGRGRARRDTC